jgi:hypothetical protein
MSVEWLVVLVLEVEGVRDYVRVDVVVVVADGETVDVVRRIRVLLDDYVARGLPAILPHLVTALPPEHPVASGAVFHVRIHCGLYR